MSITEQLFHLQDPSYGDFQFKITPTVPRERFIGVRVPELRRFAKKLLKEAKTEEVKAKEVQAFLKELPHPYFDEDMLHALLICEINDYEDCVIALNTFLPYVDNWAVCDIMNPTCFRKNREKLLDQIRMWSKAEDPYTCRFGLKMLMTYFLEDEFQPEYLEIPASIHRGEYYVNMMIAWFFATALAKQWEATIPYIKQQRLEPWTHNKAIQKSIESRRLSSQQKNDLKEFRK